MPPAEGAVFLTVVVIYHPPLLLQLHLVMNIWFGHCAGLITISLDSKDHAYSVVHLNT